MLGLKFAPLQVPFRRRLQTLSVFYLTTSFLFSGLIGTLFFIYLFFTPYYFVSVMYLTWLYYDWDKPNQGGRGLKCARRMRSWRYFANYFPAKLIKTADLDPSKNYIIGFHPHGVMSSGCVSNFGSDVTGFDSYFPGIKAHCLTLEGNFKVPFNREVLLLLGFCSVSRKSIDWILSKKGTGNACVIVVGGAAEALDARPGEATLTLKNRKGFIKMAIRHGASLVPVYSFGENDLYYQVPNPVGSTLRTLQQKFAKIVGVSPPLVSGRGVFNYSVGYLPRRRPIFTVVGKPIDVEKIENPTQEDIDKIHSEYLQQLKEIYDKYKHKYGDPEKELIFQ